MKTIILGTEHDETLRQALMTTLKGLGAVHLDRSRGHAGSQDLEVTKVKIGNDIVTIEFETFVGLSVIGPPALVDQIALLTRQTVRSGKAPAKKPAQPKP